ncbi:MAG TPA: anthranilate phosphoribosyltransferase [Beutenbergiaceae bacterium]|nr:anthranilate phosphoribosyltransferase [Beutenbergiaceae bacterium]
MTEQTWPDLITQLIEGHDLSLEQAEWAMDQVMAGQTQPTVLAGFLVALRAKGEVVPEIRGFAASMLAHAVPVQVPGACLDLVGTGGDRHHSVNISTMAALVVAGTGRSVVKHGNRAASSSSGSADVLEALGVRLDLPPERAGEVLQEAGITFLFATLFHPSFRHAATARRDLGIPTAFNVLGPLTNPARPRAGAIGVGNRAMAPIMAGVISDRGDRALVFRSEDGLDELAPTAAAQIWEVSDLTGGKVVPQRLDPVAELGLAPATLADLRGADASFNATVAREVLSGRGGAVRDAVVLNAAAALVADGYLPGTDEGDLVDRLHSGMQWAAAAIDDGRAATVLEKWVAVTSS